MNKKIIGGVIVGMIVGIFIGWYFWGRPGKVISEGVTSSGNRYQIIDTQSNDPLGIR